ncbi:hypothetical protein ACL1BA_13935, partial [Corynebacterium striatum]
KQLLFNRINLGLISRVSSCHSSHSGPSPHAGWEPTHKPSDTLHLGGVQEDFEKERDEADELTDKAQQCSNAIEEIVDVSDTALTELISAVVPLLNILTMIAAKHPLGRFIVPIIATIGADLIERTNDTIVNTCRDRDSAIEESV